MHRRVTSKAALVLRRTNSRQPSSPRTQSRTRLQTALQVRLLPRTSHTSSVIEEIQEIVALFNRKLRAQVMATSGLMWLSMFDHLTLVPKDLQLDGLHLHPQYLPQLEQGIEAHSNPAAVGPPTL